MNRQLFVGASRAIRLTARRAAFVTQLHPSDLGYFTQADLSDPQLKWHSHLISHIQVEKKLLKILVALMMGLVEEQNLTRVFCCSSWVVTETVGYFIIANM